jgi:hypothetical protein
MDAISQEDHLYSSISSNMNCKTRHVLRKRKSGAKKSVVVFVPGFHPGLHTLNPSGVKSKK